MTKYKIISLCLVCCFTVFCSSQKPVNSNQTINVQDLQLGSIKSKLSETQVQKIKDIQEVFKEVDKSPSEKWLDDFSRDANPDKEIAIWETMAKAYKDYCKDKNLSLEVKQEVFSTLLLRSSASSDAVLKDLKLKFLTKDDAIEIMSLYKDVPHPIEVEKK